MYICICCMCMYICVCVILSCVILAFYSPVLCVLIPGRHNTTIHRYMLTWHSLISAICVQSHKTNDNHTMTPQTTYVTSS